MVLARFQQKGGFLNALHDVFKATLAGLPLTELGVDECEILLLKRAFASAQQRLVYDLALAEHVFQPVAGKRTS